MKRLLLVALGVLALPASADAQRLTFPRAGAALMRWEHSDPAGFTSVRLDHCERLARSSVGCHVHVSLPALTVTLEGQGPLTIPAGTYITTARAFRARSGKVYCAPWQDPAPGWHWWRCDGLPVISSS